MDNKNNYSRFELFCLENQLNHFTMKKIIALGGSNSTKSINKTLAIYVANRVEGAETTIIDLNDYELPLYSPDLQQSNGFPENAHKINDLLESTDGIVLSLAEYNGAYATAFKNVFDWLSRIDRKLWKQKPMLLMATSPGKRGGIGVLNIAKNAFPYYGANIVADFSLPQFRENFTPQGIKDQELDNELKEAIIAFQEALGR